MPVTSIFTYVNDTDVSSFMNNISDYESKIVFLGSSYQIATKNKIYGNKQGDWNTTNPDDPSYIKNKPSTVDLSPYVSKNELSEQSYAGYSYVYAAYAYVLNTIVDNELVIAFAFNELNDKIENCTSYAYIEERLTDLDVAMSAYVSKTELTNQSYVTGTFVSSNYPTYTYLEQRIENNVSYSYLNSKLSDIVEKTSYSYSFVTDIDLVEEINSTSTYSQYASAKATYDFIDDEHMLIAAVATELDSRVNSVASNTITTEAQTYLNSLGEATAYLNNAYSYISSFDYLYAAALTNLESRIAQLETYHNN